MSRSVRIYGWVATAGLLGYFLYTVIDAVKDSQDSGRTAGACICAFFIGAIVTTLTTDRPKPRTQQEIGCPMSSPTAPPVTGVPAVNGMCCGRER